MVIVIESSKHIRFLFLYERMPRKTIDIINAPNTFFESHTTELTSRKWGVADSLRDLYNSQTELKASMRCFKVALHNYRVKNNIQLINDADSWYEKNKKPACA
jgi:hypothetical protein